MTPEGLVQVSAIRVIIDGKEFEFTPDQARRLRDALNDLLGRTSSPVVIPVPVNPFPNYPQPIWVNPNAEPWPERWWTTCSVLGQTITLCINA